METLNNAPDPLIRSDIQQSVGIQPAGDPDAELMLQVKEGDEPSFGKLHAKHRSRVVNFLFRMVQDRSVAEELTQEVFLRVFRSRATYIPKAKFTTWLFRIATRLALNSRRDGRRERSHQRLDQVTPDAPGMQLADLKPNVEQSMLTSARLDEVRSAIAALPERQRAAVVMHKYEDMDYADIAKALSCSESAVKSSLFRAYESLRGRLSHLMTLKPLLPVLAVATALLLLSFFLKNPDDPARNKQAAALAPQAVSPAEVEDMDRAFNDLQLLHELDAKGGEENNQPEEPI